MRKVGTISSAMGFIFLGVWMIINKTNYTIGQEMLKWWPVIIIILGLEVIVYFNRKAENEHVGFNGLVIIIVIIFICINVLQGVDRALGEGFRRIKGDKSINYTIDMFKNIDENRYKVIYSDKEISNPSESLYFNFDNAEVKLKKSGDANIKFETKIYIDKNSSAEKYDIQEQRDSSGITVSMRNRIIRKVEATIYVPNGTNLYLEGSNLSVKSLDDLMSSKIAAKADNGNADIFKVSEGTIDFNNGNINIQDIKNIKLNSNNTNVSVKGKSENIDIRANNGKIDIDNEVCKNVDINSNFGVVKVQTKDQDIQVNIDVDSGIAALNGDKKINSGISQTFGSGIGSVKVKLNSGTVNVRND